MRILLDECMPRQLRRELPEHEVQIVNRMRWDGLANGALLRRAAETFDVFITVDRGMPFQQNLRNVPLAVIVLRVRRNDLEHIRPLLPRIEAALKTIRRGELVELSAL